MKNKNGIIEYIKKLNRAQRLILAIVIPAILFVITAPIAAKTGAICSTVVVIDYAKECKEYPFNWSKTWHIWLLYLMVVGVIEYILYSNINNTEDKV
jgi:hypothetical protein